MLSYEICKQLKEVGFPCSDSWHIGTPYKDGSFEWFDGEEPTLSELIEACGDDFIGLNRNFNDDKAKWYADTRTHECNCGKPECRGFNWECECGETPEEAVAKLYLEIKKVNKWKLR